MSNDEKQYPSGSEFIAKKILEDDFESVFQFFQEAFQWCADFERHNQSDYVVVIITRRCNALFTIFYQIILYYASLASEKRPKYFLNYLTSDILSRIKPHFITDECLLANSQEVADFIKNHEYVCAPDILILDEMMLHGRTMNRMLDNFVKNVCGILKNNHEESQNYYESLIEDKITIKVFALNDRPLCFLPAYQRALEVNRVTNQLEWRTLSQKFSTLVSAGKTNNAAFSWNCVISKGDLFYKPLVDILDKKTLDKKTLDKKTLDKKTDPSSFFYIPTKIHGTRENNYLYLWPDACNPKVVATIRWKKCYYNDGELRWPVEKENYSILLTPFLIHGQVPTGNYENLFDCLKQDIPKQYGSLLDLHSYEKKGSGFRGRWMAQVTELVLCQLLCRRFFSLMLRKEDLSALQKCVDIDTIVRNYISLTDTFEVGVSEKKEISASILKLLEWQPDDRLLDSYFSILLRENVNPLWNTSSVGNITEDNTAIIENILSDKIIELGYSSERKAFEFYKNDVSLVTYGYLNWIRDIHTYRFLENVTGEVADNCANHMTAVANLIQEMDLGIIAMQIAVEQDTCVTIMRAGEQALFEEPRRFKKFIPVLVSLEQDYKDYENIMVVKLQEFVKMWNKRRGKEDITVEQLMNFWKHQNDSGQDMKSWLINFEPYYLNPDTEESDVSQMIENMSDEIEIQDCYLSLGWGVQ